MFSNKETCEDERSEFHVSEIHDLSEAMTTDI